MFPIPKKALGALWDAMPIRSQGFFYIREFSQTGCKMHAMHSRYNYQLTPGTGFNEACASSSIKESAFPIFLLYSLSSASERQVEGNFCSARQQGWICEEDPDCIYTENSYTAIDYDASPFKAYKNVLE